MKKTFFPIFILLLAVFMSAEAAGMQPQTLLFLLSSQGDPIGDGKIHLYQQHEGNFTVQTDKKHSYLKFSFVNKNREEKEDWTGFFTPAKGEKLKTTLYRKVQKYQGAAYGGLDFCSGAKNCETVRGNFEILELNKDTTGEVCFAAHFLQRCNGLYSPPLFGSIRLNSSLPVKASVEEMLGRFCPESFLYFVKTNSQGDQIVKYLTNKDFDFHYERLREDDEMIRVELFIKDSLESSLEFNRNSGSGFYYSSSDEKIYSGYHSAFNVTHLAKNQAGEIIELAINFKARSLEGEILEASLRFNTDVPINLLHPCE